MRGTVTAVLVVALATVTVAVAGAASTAEVTMPGKLFAPRELDVLVGTTVTWRNTDRGTHTVTEDEDAFDSGHVRPGQSFSMTFGESGTFRFHCTIHRFMRGAVRVFEVVLGTPHEPAVAGRRVRLHGVAPAGVTEVTLWRVLPGPAAVVARATPAPDGAFEFLVRAPEPRRYIVQAGAATSPRVLVRVVPRVSIARRGAALVVQALPARPGSRVVLEAYERELFDFVPVARGRLDSASRARIQYVPATAEHVRAVVVGSGGWSDGVSRPVVVRP